MASLITVTNLTAQSFDCGIYTKSAASGQFGPFYTDRFSNIYSEEELRLMLYKSEALDCQATDPFNVVIHGTTYLGNNFPTPEQEMVICHVFNYLASIIEVPGNGGTANILVVFDPSLAGSGNAGVATPLFKDQCGIGYSILQEQLNTQNPVLPLDFIHGYIYINPQINWYTELDLVPAIGSNEVDLYTVVLHEALHVLGFASHIGASGNAIDGFYSLFDLHLENDSEAEMIIASGAPNDCCIEYQFNSTDFPDMPGDILDCGDVLFDVAQAPPVNGQYSFTPPLSDGTAANILSHLNISCGTENYVMHASIGTGATTNGIPNIRRTLTDAEIEIMCSIGYNMSTICDAECFVIVRDDGPFVLNEPVATIPYSWLTANDFDSEGNYDITFDFDCGDTGDLDFDPDDVEGELVITLNNTPFGVYEICCTILSCDGKLCGTGRIRLIVAEEIDPTLCFGEDCNLVGYGDFELFPTGFGVYYSTFAEPWNSEVIIVQGAIPDNSVDIISYEDNQFLRFIRCDHCSIENVLMPLCDPIPADCDITVSFDACSDNSANGNQPVTLGVWGFSQVPDPLQLPGITVCNGILMDDSGSVIGICLGEVVLTQCDVVVTSEGSATQPVDFTHYTVTFPDGFSEPITHIWFFDYPSYPNGWTEVFLDNVSVTTGCDNRVTITPTVLEACICDQAVIELEICLNGPINTPADIVVTPNLQEIPGVTLSSGNPDFPNGVATIEDLLPGACVTLTLFLDISCAFSPDTEITIPIGLDVTGACAGNPDGQEMILILEDCEERLCDCPQGSIVIGSPGVETLLSDLVDDNLMPASPQFGTPLNITVRGTLIIDANVITSTQTGAYLFPPLSDICMDAGAEIRIPSENTLSIFDTHIRGCEKRWKSITVEQGAVLNLLGEGLGLVEDGQYAVFPRSRSIVNIVNTRFDKNYSALYFNDPSGPFVLRPFYGNTMECTGNLLPHYNPQDPNDGPWSFTGIHTIGQNQLTIGVAGAEANRFDYLRNGIIAENCNLTLRNSYFSNIKSLDYTPLAGYGVRATGAGQNFFQDGSCYSSNKTVIFDFCDTGIYLKGMNARVRNNEMNSVFSGVIVEESPNRDIEICGNVIKCGFRGISLNFNDPAARIRVNNNDILLEPPQPDARAAAIFVVENGAPQPDASIEFHDNIEVTDAGAGISLIGADGYNIEQNFIDIAQSDALSYAGISLLNSPNGFLSCNSVDGDFETNSYGGPSGPFGLRARAATGVQYDCNDVQDTFLGIQFDMGCGDTEFRTASFTKHRYGLHYTATAVTGTQPMNLSSGPLHGNRWNGTWGGANSIGARHENPEQNFVNLSRYLVRSISAPLGPENPSSTSNDWFSAISRQELSCGVTCNVWLTEEPPVRDLDLLVAEGEVDPGVFVAPMQWMLERDLYRKLYRYPALIEEESVLENFYDDNAATTVGRFTEMEAAIRALFDLDGNTAGRFQDYHSWISEAMEEIGAIDSLTQTASGQDSLDLLVQRSDATELIDSLSVLNSALSDSTLYQRSLAAIPLIAQNNAITAEEIWEENEKMANHIFLNTFARGIPPNGAQASLLTYIAMQCPYEGGTAVFRARAMLDGLLELEFDDETACGQGGAQALTTPPSAIHSAAFGVHMYPNPAIDIVTVRMDDALESSAVLSIHNLYGQLVSGHTLPEGTDLYSFSTASLPQGIYLVRIEDGKETIFAERLVITR